MAKRERCILSFWLNEISAIHTSELTSFGFQSKHIHLMKYCEFAYADNIENLGIFDVAEKESG